MLNLDINSPSPNDEEFNLKPKRAIKPNFVTQDDIEEFINAGGVINKLEFGKCSEFEITNFKRLTPSEKAQKKLEAKKSKNNPPIHTPETKSSSNSTKAASSNTQTKSIKEVAQAILKARNSQSQSSKSLTVDPQNTVNNIKKTCNSETAKEGKNTPKPKYTKKTNPKQLKSKAEPKPPKVKKPKTISEETIRISELRKARQKAIDNNEKTFQATCKTHGLTTYAFYGQTVRCKICRENQDAATSLKQRSKNLESKQQLIINSERLERNFASYLKAIAENKTIFIAECHFHGLSAFITEKRTINSTKGTYRCLECKKLSHFIYRKKKAEKK